MIDLEKNKREVLRWWVLQTLNFARPVGANIELIHAAVKEVIVDITQREIKLALDYLEARGLLELDKSKRECWHAKLLRYGIDIVEYTVPVEPGIARPERAWD